MDPKVGDNPAPKSGDLFANYPWVCQILQQIHKIINALLPPCLSVMSVFLFNDCGILSVANKTFWGYHTGHFFILNCSFFVHFIFHAYQKSIVFNKILVFYEMHSCWNVEV